MRIPGCCCVYQESSTQKQQMRVTSIFSGWYCADFSNNLSDMRLQDLAEGDPMSLILSVQEVFGDFITLDKQHFSIPIPKHWVALAPPTLDFSAASDMIDRVTEGLGSVMLSLRHRFQIRYQRGSEMTHRIAQSLHQLTNVDQRELFDFGSRDISGQNRPLLLILDRKQDPVTPLLSQWTYQAMIHEILGILDNVVVAPGSLNTPKTGSSSISEYVMSSAQDEFFRSNMHSNFGDVGMAVKRLVDRVSSEHKQVRDFNSLDDIAQFVENLPDATTQQSITAKHVAIMSALSQEVEHRALMTVSGVEQDLCCQSSSVSGHFDSVAILLRNPSISHFDKMRLVVLYALRYEEEAPKQTSSLFSLLEDAGVDSSGLDTVRYIRNMWKLQDNVLDLFSDKTLGSRFANLAKQHLKGVENVYTQHTPPLVSIIEKASKGRLPLQDFPSVDGDGTSVQKVVSLLLSESILECMCSSVYVHACTVLFLVVHLYALLMTYSIYIQGTKLIVVFVVGGSTYEEAKAVDAFNSGKMEGSTPGVQVVLGGTGVQRAKTFIEDLRELSISERISRRRR